MNWLVNHNIDTWELTWSQVLKAKLRGSVLLSEKVFIILEQSDFFTRTFFDNSWIWEELNFVNNDFDITRQYWNWFFEPFFLKYDNKLWELNSVMHVINHWLYVGAISAWAIFKVLSNPEIVKSKQEQISIIRILRSYLIESSEKTIFSCTRKYLEDWIRSFMEKNEISKQELEKEDIGEWQKVDNKNINNFIFEVAKSILERIITYLVNNEINTLYIKTLIEKNIFYLIEDISTWIFVIFKHSWIENEKLSDDFTKYFDLVKSHYVEYNKNYWSRFVRTKQDSFWSFPLRKQLAWMLEPLIDAFMHPNDKVARIRFLDLIKYAWNDNYRYIIRIWKRVLWGYWYNALIWSYLYRWKEKTDDRFFSFIY